MACLILVFVFMSLSVLSRCMTRSKLNAFSSSNDLYKELLESSPLPFFVIDTDGLIVFATTTTMKMFAGEVVGVRFLDLVDNEFVPAFKTAITKSIEGEVGEVVCVEGFCFEFARGAEAKPLTYYSSLLMRTSSEHFAQHLLIYCYDITSHFETTQQLRYEAEFDSLTHISNRKSFLTNLQILATKSRNKKTPFGICFIDIDEFKAVNDTYGHIYGDILLERIAQRLRRISSEFSVFVARLGGDEFTMLAESNVDVNRMKKLGETIVHEIGRDFLINEDRISVGASVGMVIIDDDYYSLTEDEYMRCADKAMYKAKKDGKGRYILYNELDTK